MSRFYLLLVLLSVTVYSGSAHSESMGEFANLVIRAAEWYEMTGAEPGDVLERLNSSNHKLDSLKAMYMPLDTLSGRIGIERVCRIASCYTDLDAHETSLEWWNLLGRIDNDGYFDRERYSGLIRTGVGLSDSTLLMEMLTKAEMLKPYLKRQLSEDLMAGMSYLYLHKVDRSSLEKRFERLKGFLPGIDAAILEGRLLADKGDWQEAHSLYVWLIDRVTASQIEPVKALMVVNAALKTSIWSGHLSEAKEYISLIIDFGNEPMISRAKLWLPGIHLLEGHRDKAHEQYTLICNTNEGADMACFWQAYLERYAEVMSEVP